MDYLDCSEQSFRCKLGCISNQYPFGHHGEFVYVVWPLFLIKRESEGLWAIYIVTVVSNAIRHYRSVNGARVSQNKEHSHHVPDVPIQP